jgi:hypothetical protein
MLQAEESLRWVTIMTVAQPECDPSYRQAVLSAWEMQASGHYLPGRRLDGTYEITSAAELRRFFIVEGGFGVGEL